jgi:hypothetical protein
MSSPTPPVHSNPPVPAPSPAPAKPLQFSTPYVDYPGYKTWAATADLAAFEKTLPTEGTEAQHAFDRLYRVFDVVPGLEEHIIKVQRPKVGVMPDEIVREFMRGAGDLGGYSDEKEDETALNEVETASDDKSVSRNTSAWKL